MKKQFNIQIDNFSFNDQETAQIVLDKFVVELKKLGFEINYNYNEEFKKYIFSIEDNCNCSNLDNWDSGLFNLDH